MLKHQLLVIYRTFKRFKSTFLINLTGLSTGLACALLIYLWVFDELQVDQFHEKKGQLVQVMENRPNAGGVLTQENTPDLLAETMAAELPEVEAAAAVMPASLTPPFTVSVDNVHLKAAGQFVGKDFFNLFSCPLLEGDQRKVLADKNGVVISEDLALKLFHTTQQVVGRTLTWQMAQFKSTALITGIFRNLPASSSAQFDLVLTDQLFRDPQVFDRSISWGNHTPFTYLLLKKDTDPAQFNQKIAQYLLTKDPQSTTTLFIRPYADSYLYGKYENGRQAGGRIEYVKLFSLIAVFILVIACINFMNLSTARASARIKEVGIKKAIGASRRSLAWQYLAESICMALLALLVAVALVASLLSAFNDIAGKQLSFQTQPVVYPAFLAIALLTGLLAGSYPALYLSGFSPIAVLKGGALSRKSSPLTGELWARKGLVVFQFTLSVMLILSVWVVYRQIAYVQSRNIGYNKDNVLYFPKEGKIGQHTPAFLAEVKKVPGVLNASAIVQNIVGRQGGTSGLDWPGKDPAQEVRFSNITVDYGAIETLGMQMAAGRPFSPGFGADSTTIIFNEAAIKAMGLTNPVGKTVKLWGEDRLIVGVVKDFNFESLHENVAPAFLKLGPEATMSVLVAVQAGRERETIARLQKVYQAFNPGFSFNYRFLDQDFQNLYIAEQRVSALSRYFAGLAILISCLGLFGLAAFTAERRNKEIGIRKVLGASVTGIVVLLSRDFVQLVLIALGVALPTAYYLMQQWLAGFAYRVDIPWWSLGVVALLVVGIALATVSLQSIKAALTDPVRSLKTE